VLSLWLRKLLLLILRACRRLALLLSPLKSIPGKVRAFMIGEFLYFAAQSQQLVRYPRDYRDQEYSVGESNGESVVSMT